jgi:hypothetical protein
MKHYIGASTLARKTISGHPTDWRSSSSLVSSSIEPPGMETKLCWVLCPEKWACRAQTEKGEGFVLSVGVLLIQVLYLLQPHKCPAYLVNTGHPPAEQSSTNSHSIKSVETSWYNLSKSILMIQDNINSIERGHNNKHIEILKLAIHHQRRKSREPSIKNRFSFRKWIKTKNQSKERTVWTTAWTTLAVTCSETFNSNIYGSARLA